MNKHGTLPVDLTAIASQSYAYIASLSDIEDVGHHVNAFNPLDLDALKTNVPTFEATFASLGLTVAWCAHRTVNNNSMLRHPVIGNTLFIPLMECENTVLKLFDAAPGATMIDNSYYSASDTTLSESLALTSPILVVDQAIHQLVTTDANLADVLVVAFDAGDAATLAQYFA